MNAKRQWRLKMKIEIWSDYVCPFCYIGSQRLTKVLEAFEGRDEVILEYRSFELDPEKETGKAENVYEHLAEKYGITVEEARQNVRNVEVLGSGEGLVIDNERAIQANTFDAHRLGQLARTEGKSKEFTALLYKAHFADGTDLGDHASLLKLAEQAGLDGDAAQAVLHGDTFAKEVRRDEEVAREIGIGGVPFFVFNEKFAVSGAQSKETFAKVLKKALEDGKSSE
jgi:predicted DsbA family dithiol-disulfide isomerase